MRLRWIEIGVVAFFAFGLMITAADYWLEKYFPAPIKPPVIILDYEVMGPVVEGGWGRMLIEISDIRHGCVLRYANARMTGWRDVQQALNERGADPRLTVDGLFGALSRRAWGLSQEGPQPKSPDEALEALGLGPFG
ncbi:MAG: hypothetical protein ACU0A2_15345 [Cognatishimia sp.]|uniref:hypothetical protein n=1 Tax=Cognatishimia sp. TaxID=2211648 RepID=UPI0040595636